MEVPDARLAVVAKHLDIKLYDKEMLNRAAQESGLCKELC